MKELEQCWCHNAKWRGEDCVHGSHFIPAREVEDEPKRVIASLSETHCFIYSIRCHTCGTNFETPVDTGQWRTCLDCLSFEADYGRKKRAQTKKIATAHKDVF